MEGETLQHDFGIPGSLRSGESIVTGRAIRQLRQEIDGRAGLGGGIAETSVIDTGSASRWRIRRPCSKSGRRRLDVTLTLPSIR
jgi:hypothetical protein